MNVVARGAAGGMPSGGAGIVFRSTSEAEEAAMSEIAHEWLTVREVARHFRVSDRTVTRWVNTDPSMRVRRLGPSGRVIRIHRSELNREQDLPAAA